MSEILAGFALFALAYRMDKTATYEDGSFIGEMVLVLVGIGCVILGLARLFYVFVRGGSYWY